MRNSALRAALVAAIIALPCIVASKAEAGAVRTCTIFWTGYNWHRHCHTHFVAPSRAYRPQPYFNHRPRWSYGPRHIGVPQGPTWHVVPTGRPAIVGWPR